MVDFVIMLILEAEQAIIEIIRKSYQNTPLLRKRGGELLG